MGLSPSACSVSCSRVFQSRSSSVSTSAGLKMSSIVLYTSSLSMRYAPPITASTDGCKVGLAHQMRPDTREISLQKLRVPVEDQLGHPPVEDRVAEELQPPV